MIKNTIFRVQYAIEYTKEKLANFLYMTGWHCNSLYWASWHAFNKTFLRPKPLESQHKTSNLPKEYNRYTVILTPDGQKMLEDIARINNHLNGVKYSHQQWIAAVINTQLSREHKTALELQASIDSSKRKDHLKVIK